MSITKNLAGQLKKIQAELTIPHISLLDLEKLSLETKKAFDEAIKRLEIKRDFLKKADIRRDHLKLWKHKGKQVILPINWRYLLSVPFIYGMIIPAIVWHIGLEIYHQVCFRFYGIPLVKPREYFIYDRQLLSYLNPWEKVNCYYCSYVNNLIRYSSEIGGRTERYWCPIKYVRRVDKAHSQYSQFIDIKDEKTLRQEWNKLRDFSDIDSKE
ncbi:MAG: hypothetical protein XD98_0051 [Microgenomates bacterium 39_6]|nr:MAG: hypothetical protein XD98_0051 [Microgenomates bacterium 39_6]